MSAAELKVGERVMLIDAKDRHYLITLREGAEFHTHAGIVQHNDVIGSLEGSLIRGSTERSFLALRPTLSDVVLKMPRGAQVIYPKDLGTILDAGRRRTGHARARGRSRIGRAVDDACCAPAH
jgi:tRNA (adenine57-N1/adenine58-N1)-methyltransferase